MTFKKGLFYLYNLNMDKKVNAFLKLASLFNSKGYLLYMVGGTVRDYLLDIPLTDMDLVTDATPKDVEEFLDADFTFKQYGSIRYKDEDGNKFDITTLRKEEGYSDYRHPSKICFTKSIKEDVFRRDITINAMYIDEKLNVIDLVGGQNDLKNKMIVMVGDPLKRIKEDPLRIIRIYRFKLETGFFIEKNLENVLESNFDLVNLLNKDKIKQEISKSHHQEELKEILKSHQVKIDL